jgi:hypothetical protein
MQKNTKKLREIIRFGVAKMTKSHSANSTRMQRRIYSLRTTNLAMWFTTILVTGFVLLGSNGVVWIATIFKKIF